MARKTITTSWDGENRNNFEHNFKELYNDLNNIVSSITDEVYQEIINGSKLNWLDFVDTYEDIATTYPNPSESDTVMARSDSADYPTGPDDKRQGGTIWRYDGSEWQPIQNIDASVINAVEEQLTQWIDANEQEINSINSKLSNQKLADVQEPFYIAHRGASNIFPENTLEAYKGCLALGNNFIEMDVQTLADGSLGVMHDDTVNRTTDKTGYVYEYSAMGFRNLNVDVPTPYKNVSAPLFEDIVNTFGNSAIYCPESKDKKSVQKIINVLDKYKLKDYALIQSSDINDLQPAIDAGYATLLITNMADPATISAAGIGYVGVSKSVADSYIQSCIDNGLKVIAWTVNNRYEKEELLAKGVHGFFSDDPFYLSESIPASSKDTFIDQTFGHGMLASGHTNRGGFISPNKWGFTNILTDDTVREYVLQGWAGELSQTYTMNLDITFESGTYWGSVAINTPIDYFEDSPNGLSDGYQILFIASGSIYVYKGANGVATQIGNVTGGEDLQKGTPFSVEIEVTPTGIRVTNVDQNLTAEITDSEYRGGYLHFGRREAKWSFSNVVIS
ncbi:glycerophosphodiester phosphodiesterase [Virgibacillus sp. AGTR]|uniref:glycerophosphodiester phosphodiesterase n=1 Tax=Virgibacillus sp. AGTR TaxID=2812055 RepID=UPI001D15FC51|nr:glycerophosphodiester phosphodiesterase [Virgibacillus sp. AGTR]MCC2248864.1 glycerophosphodiester phosphodiesterase [Virgibacillus sp. AGTR]